MNFKNIRMKRIILIASIALCLIACRQTSKTSKQAQITDKQKSEAKGASSANELTPRVTGIGGIFFYSDNLVETKKWYAENLGIEFNDWGSSSFESRNINNPGEINTLQWKPFKTGSDYFSPSNKDFMINYTVQNIEGLVSKLKDKGIIVLDSIATYDFGKFVHVMDKEGNKIELWEPVNNDKKDSKSTPQTNTAGKQLYETILLQDSLLFQAFNTQDFDRFKRYFTEDLEIYQDNIGVRTFDQSMEAFNNLFKLNSKLTRKLVKESVEIYPVKDFGAIETGSHTFCHVENGKPDCGTYKFVHIWKLVNGSWKICRIVTYDHK